MITNNLENFIDTLVKYADLHKNEEIDFDAFWKGACKTYHFYSMLECLEQNGNEWMYVSGYEGADSTVKLQNKNCGHYRHVSAAAVRRLGKDFKTLPCKICIEKEMQRKREFREEYRQLKREEIEMKPATEKVCAVCPTVFMGRPDQPCCSDECYEIYMMGKKRQPRSGIPKSARTKETKQIDLGSVYKKYNGVCYLCGEKTFFSAGDKNDLYPTIEHIKPLSKGGLDEWKNVRLAHMGCNRRKGNCENAKEVLKRIAKASPQARLIV